MARIGELCGLDALTRRRWRHRTVVAGSPAQLLLEIDHFHPVAAGGSDDDENLVYACTACNRFKGEYMPAPGAPET
jgi:5-methylcytosine-specific restriction endonuclease McrA